MRSWTYPRSICCHLVMTRRRFLNIKCRKAGLAPSAVVIVATVRAMKMNGGVKKDDLGAENVAAVQEGCANWGVI